MFSKAAWSFAAVGVLALVLCFPSGARAAEPPTVIVPNTVVRFVGAGCPPDSDQQAFISASHATGGVLTPHFTASPTGTFDVALVVPWWGERTADVDICDTVWPIRYIGVPDAPTLPFTGRPVAAEISVAAALVLLGGIGATLAREPRRHTAEGP